ncbi:alternative ribosome rescue aminoacyl-tRNA hydrolase ArfB [Lapillicoccus jejuensis]|uniref:Ribosome-associated protein n=1 Tax=Lapillicoccus jejuensis TaxID=402171 RepID=A0A542E6G4_9MICO|nr:alternative ribosome rescue aminoacyl-tRNA hydrolase ArfB [Lapillicoccus jejuensis]TQJ10917.1 ribosome-associated protein [Lapillicoccus jejuensis]
MDDLVVPAGPGLSRGLIVPAGELVERFSRSSGPGGQGVNTTDSRVELVFDPAASAASGALAGLPDATRRRVLSRLAPRLVGGVVQIAASEHRSQRRNRAAARERLAALLREAAAPPPPTRRATRPTLGSQRRRLAGKKARGQTKAGRGRVSPQE